MDKSQSQVSNPLPGGASSTPADRTSLRLNELAGLAELRWTYRNPQALCQNRFNSRQPPVVESNDDTPTVLRFAVRTFNSQLPSKRLYVPEPIKS
ncbi:MAG TPA: hypothetical protein VFI24_28275 [Pyrinomonadaceae bacterium]|nr:hypothetical protein [Pyrinomonadaceae bacterium]